VSNQRSSNVREEVENKNGICESGEKPLDLSSASFLSNGATRSPGLLAPENILWVYTPLLLQKHEKYDDAYQEMSDLDNVPRMIKKLEKLSCIKKKII
jgi:hypothetical protein